MPRPDRSSVVAHELGMRVLARATAVVDHGDVPVERARLDRERVHRGRPADDDELRRGEERLEVHLHRPLALARHRHGDRAVELVRGRARRAGRGTAAGARRRPARRAPPGPRSARRTRRRASPARCRRRGRSPFDPTCPELGARRHTTVASTNGRRACVSCDRLGEDARRPSARGAPAPTGSPTTRGRAAAACRCCARRGARARRSPR